jgi:uncharacterized protein YjcR
MDLSKININTLREMLKLSERKEQLLKELKELEEQIVSHVTGFSSTTPSESTLQKKKRAQSASLSTAHDGTSKRASRGTMKTQILAALQEAGSAGIKVPDLAQKIGVKSANVHVWFSNTGKKLPEIERIGAGLFRIRQD